MSISQYLEKAKAACKRAWQWVLECPELTAFATIAGCAVVLINLANGYHEGFETWEASWDLLGKPWWLFLYEVYYPYLGLICQVATGIAILYCLRLKGDVTRMFKPVLAVGLGWLVYVMIREVRDKWWVETFGMMGEPPTVTFFILKQVMMTVLTLSPAFMVRWYGRQPMLQRYTLSSFFQPLIFCYSAFASLWILIDLMDKLGEFQDADTPQSVIVQLYLNLLPAIYVMVTPAAVLLAALYALTKLSRANEIVSMLTSGLSLTQILKPVLIVAAYLSLLGTAMNYHWAPRADGERESIIRDMKSKGKTKSASTATALMYRNEETGRTWYIGYVPTFDNLSDRLKRVTVYQMDGSGRIKMAWEANNAKWMAGRGNYPNIWRLYDGRVRTYKNGVATGVTFFDGTVEEVIDGVRERVVKINIENWPETPWSIISGALQPDTLGVIDLAAYEIANEDLPRAKLAPFRTHFHHRFAYPWQAFVVVLMAAPLGVAYSRRGALGGIAAAVIIFFALMFVNEFFMGLGKGMHMAPWLAAWMPNIIFGGIGYVVFRTKAANKDLPKFSPSQWIKLGKAWLAERKLARRPATA
ncbi:MAG: LptF/LptG family permease [Verrucomicrobiaceae bacterium]|nr:LptF/LptG family permease [Verrucomicrobiaceae bacterium]